MAGTWQFVPVHRVAHLAPAFTAGTVDADFQAGNVSTLDPNKVCRFSHGGGSYAEFRWDRGSGGNYNDINCVVIVNHNLGSKDCTWTLYGDSSAGGTGSTLATTSPTTNLDIFKAFTADHALRHLTLRVAVDGGGAGAGIRIGTFSVGWYLDLGGSKLRAGNVSHYSLAGNMQQSLIGVPHYAGYAEGGLAITQTFGRVLHSSAMSVMRLAARQWSPTTGDQTYDGVGGGGGKNPLALVDYDGRVYYGPASVTSTMIGPASDEMTISLNTIPHWGMD